MATRNLLLHSSGVNWTQFFLLETKFRRDEPRLKYLNDGIFFKENLCSSLQIQYEGDNEWIPWKRFVHGSDLNIGTDKTSPAITTFHFFGYFNFSFFYY